MPVDVLCWGNSSPKGNVERLTLKRRDPRPTDITFNIEWCGVCHSDSLTARSLWGPTPYPCVPGHEIVGRVTFVGSEAAKADPRLKVGSLVGVGCMVGSKCTKNPAEGPTCHECVANKEENYCEKGALFTYGSPAMFDDDKEANGYTIGGYSKFQTVDYRFAIIIPDSLDKPELLSRLAPLFCAGITCFTPIRKHNIGPGSKVAVAGLGGLGSMAVKISKHLGAHVTVLTRSLATKGELARAMGADEIVDTTDAKAFESHKNTYDLLIDTISAKHDLDSYLSVVKPRGNLVSVGVPPEKLEFHMFSLISSKHISSSPIGSIKDTQELINLASVNHNLLCDVEVITPDDNNIYKAWDRMDRSDVKFRFVIDLRNVQ